MKENITELIVQQQNDALEQLFKEYGTPSIDDYEKIEELVTKCKTIV